MNLFFVKQWEDNKHLLREHLVKNKCVMVYKDLVKLLFELVIIKADGNGYADTFNLDNLTEIDHGNYQGTLLYIIPRDTYQPCGSDYVVTEVSYGSCSGCDTLQAIFSNYKYDEDYNEPEFYSEEQVNDLMTLALHLVQRMKFIYE